MRTRTNSIGFGLALVPIVACNDILGLETAELASTAAGYGGEATTVGGAASSGSQRGGAGPSLTQRGGNGNSGNGNGGGGNVGNGNSGGGIASPTSDASGGSQVAAIGGTSSEPAGGANGGAHEDATGGFAPGGSGGDSGQPASAGVSGCAAGAGSLGGCGANAATTYSCVGQWLVSCADDGTTRSVDCSKAELCDAVSGECDVCVHDSIACADDRRRVQCTANGQGQIYSTCEAYCSGGACVACLSDNHCSDPGECLEPACSSEHTCGQTPSIPGTDCTSVPNGFCDGAGHCGTCTPGARRCSLTGIPELCVTSDARGGQWIAQAPCSNATSAVPYSCMAGVCEPPPSCRGFSANQCGSGANQHCCSAPTLPGASYSMGTNSTAPEVAVRERPAHTTYVSAIRLDAFEVTVGRFRRFLADYQGPPAVGAGADPTQTPTRVGWQAEWNSQLPAAGPGAAAAIVQGMLSNLDTATWTDLPGLHENHPINQVPWYVAFAFCAYDGGWLPSEAEWEFAASGSLLPKPTYPWGNEEPTTEHATFELSCPPSSCTTKDAFRAVGTAPKGIGPFGHYDLAGNVSEWNMDYYDETYYQQFSTSRCEYCINMTPSYYRVTRGGHALSKATALRVTARTFAAPTSVSAGIGFRCARPL